jgi:para-aminobenzoate synthetase component 1
MDVAPILGCLPVDSGCAVVRDGDTVSVMVGPDCTVTARAADAFRALDVAASGGFWVAALAYDLGRSVESVVPSSVDDLGLPDVLLARFDARLVLRPGASPVVVGSGPSRSVLERALWRSQRSSSGSSYVPLPDAWTSSLSRSQHAAAVDRVLELLRDGECYQVNLTRRLSNPVAADPVGLFGVLERANPAPHSCLLSVPGYAFVSASPELYLRVDGRSVETRPIKGTGSDPVALAASLKDRAENVMIVDLARNDLGRVCTYGSVVVPSLFAVEAHPGLHHMVSTVRGSLRPEVSFSSLIRATFPPASVTGAPKPRVLQAIEDLEPVRRGVYCGGIGWIDGDASRASLAVAIRTFTVCSSGTFFGVGGGIVADSTADAEWEETELKSARLLGAASSLVRSARDRVAER